MKLGFSSDHHFHPYSAFAKPLPGGLTTRIAEMLAVEAAALAIFKREGVSVHIRAGDLFERKNQIDAVVFSEVAAALDRSGAAGIEEVLVKGNHDLAGGGTRNSLEALARMNNVQVVSEPTKLEFGGNFAEVVVVPYDDDVEAMKQGVIELSNAFDEDTPKTRLLVLHGQIHGSKSGSEFVLPGTLTTEDLMLDRFDWALLGHVHEPQNLTRNSCYIGSFCQRMFTDEGSQRRVLVVDKHGLKEFLLPGPKFVTESFMDPDQLRAYVPEANGYYKLTSYSRDVTTEMIDDHFDGRCLGWFPLMDVKDDTQDVRISPTMTRWEDIIESYVRQTRTELSIPRLIELGAQFRREAPDAAT